jgi:preprotein translocase SecF subunit
MALSLIPQNTAVNFMRLRWLGFFLSLILIAGSLGMFMTKGLNLGIDFTGGILIEVRTESAAELAPLREAFEQEAFGEISLQHFGDDREVLVRIQTKAEEEHAAVVEQAKSVITTVYGEGVDFRRVDYVGPTVGEELKEAGTLSLLVAFIAVLLYIWFRFEWQFGVGAVIALIHDATLTVGFFVVTEFEFSLSAIAAILTVIGYSINDSVVIYDRIRENMRKYKQKTMFELINLSLNETLSRTVLTGLTTLLAAGSLGVLGGEVLEGFSWALFFGVLIGTYSSIYIAAPVLLYFNVRSDALSDEPAAA